MNFFLVLRNITAQHVNALNNINSVGFPAITGFLGFAEALAFEYGFLNKGVCIIHKGQEIEGHTTKYKELKTNKIRGPSTGINKKDTANGLALSDQPSVLSHFSSSLIINFESKDQEDEKNINETDLYRDLETGKLMHMLLSRFRFIGGSIVDIDAIKILDDYLECEKYLVNEKGFFVLDARSVVENRKEDLSQVDAIRDALYFQKEDFKNDGENEFEKRWFAMTSVGYFLLESPQEKECVRNNKKHAFAENLLGLIEFKSIRHVDLESVDVFWEYQKLENVVVAQQQEKN